MTSLRISVRDRTGEGGPRPVTGGVPLPAGAAPDGTVFALTTATGRAVPLQSRVLARWKDGSARWLLLDFTATVPARGEARFALGASAAALAAVAFDGVPLKVREGSAFLNVGGDVALSLVLTLGNGAVCPAVATAVDPECEGPLRRTFLVRGEFRSPEGNRVFQVHP